MRLRYVMILLLTVGIASCSSLLSPVKTEQENSYLLNTVPYSIPHRAMHASSMLVLQPEGDQVYNTNKIAFTTKAHQIGYYGLNRWAETPAEMIQALLVQTLQNTHYFHAVSTAPAIGHYDYMLRTQIHSLLFDFTPGKYPMAIVSIRAQLISMKSNRIIKTKIFSAQVPIQQISPYGGVIAANTATAEVMKKIAYFCTSL